MTLTIPQNIMDMAIEAKGENFNILNPKVYTKHKVKDEAFLESVRQFINSDLPMDIVLFSSKSGADTHTDIHLKHLDTHTYIIPIILPENGKATITHSGGVNTLEYANPVKIDHQQPHRLDVENETGCVVLMASKILSTSNV